MIYKVILLLAIFASVQVQGNEKYSKEANVADMYMDTDSLKDEPTPFRMLKVNILWSKAKGRVDENELANLYADLKVHDEYEISLKSLRADGMDKDGATEEKVLLHYKQIVARYLPDHAPSESRENNEIPDEGTVDGSNKEFQFPDPKLQGMWLKAQDAGFSEEDLQILKQEFEHQQMKINERRSIHRELFPDVLDDTDDNIVDLEQKKSKHSFEEAMALFGNLKRQANVVRKGYKVLEELVSNLPSSNPTFEDEKVQQLWALAKKTNWTSEELKSFQMELQHFESRVSKHNYYKEELELAKAAVDAGEGDIAVEKHEFLSEKAKATKTKMTKIHSELQSRVDGAVKHTEL